MLIVKHEYPDESEEVYEAAEVRFHLETKRVLISGTHLGLRMVEAGTVTVLTQMGVEVAVYFVSTGDDEDRDPADADGGDPGGKPAGPAH